MGRISRNTKHVRFRIRPKEIEVPEHNPFENDLLDRKDCIDVLTRLVGVLEGPSVLTIDAAWGNGKSTFIRIWAQHLRNRGFPTVEFNAWETDYSSDPFVALSSELTEGLTVSVEDDFVAEKLERLKRAGKEVLVRSVPAIVRIATAGILDVSPLIEQELGQLLSSYAEKRLAEYVETKESIEDFRLVLEDFAKTLSARNCSKPLVVFVDELDRCRPSYTVELLEIAKHFFSVDHIVFVLAVNRTELAHSVKAFYGGEFDATGYLRRFIDVDFHLPDPERSKFVNAMFTQTGISPYFGRKGGHYREPLNRGVGLLQAFFDNPDLSLRRIGQAIHRLGLMQSMLQKESPASLLPVFASLILRTIDTELYRSFFFGQASDLDVATNVFGRSELKALRRTDEGIFFESLLILATLEDYISKNGWVSKPFPTFSPLMSQYESWAVSPPSELDREHAANVLNCFEGIEDLILDFQVRSRIGFRVAVRRLELLSNEMTDEHSN